MVAVGSLTPTPPSNPEEAREVLDAYVASLQARGHEPLRAIEGEVKRSYLGGFFQVMDGSGSELDEVKAPSGALYNFVTSVWAADDGELHVIVEMQDDAAPYGSVTYDFFMDPDGSVH
jgi:hypothetical protein